MTEPVKRYRISRFGNNMVETHDGAWCRQDDYARLEQECERWKETAAGLDRQNDAIADEVAAALKQVERLTAMLHRASKAESRPEFMQIIAEALSAKPCSR